MAAEPRLLLTWNAPYGQPGARDNIDVACDTSGVDTLYMCVDPGKDTPRFIGLDAVVYFHAPEEDSLPEYMRFDGDKTHPAPVRAIFDEDPERGLLMPWNAPGGGAGHYDHTRATGRLVMIYTIVANAKNPVFAGKPFGVARLLVRRPPPGADGCGRPICIEWSSSHLTYDLKDEPLVSTGKRWVTINSPGGKVCAPVRALLSPKTWEPKPRKP